MIMNTCVEKKQCNNNNNNNNKKNENGQFKEKNAIKKIMLRRL